MERASQGAADTAQSLTKPVWAVVAGGSDVGQRDALARVRCTVLRDVRRGFEAAPIDAPTEINDAPADPQAAQVDAPIAGEPAPVTQPGE